MIFSSGNLTKQAYNALGLRPILFGATMSVSENRYIFSSYQIGQDFRLKDLASFIPLTASPTNRLYWAFELGPQSVFYIYSFGSVVFFNVAAETQKFWLGQLESYVGSPLELEIRDAYFLEIHSGEKDTVTFNQVNVDQIDRDRCDLMALILAQSTALDFYEKKVEHLLGNLKKFSSGSRGRFAQLSDKVVFGMIEKIISITQDVVVSLHLLEKPEATWERKTLDDLFEEGIRMFEIAERYQAIKDKLLIVQNNLEVISNLANNRKMIWLEISIVALFVLDVLLVGYEMFFKG
jgi:uncharacterized Rmd1/YagE family protein